MPESATHVPDVLAHMREVLLLLGVAAVLVPLLQRLRLPPILGFLLCGLIIGPNALGELSARLPWLQPFVVSDLTMVTLFAELGVIFLLFTIGLELSFRRLWEMRRLVLGLGTAQIALTSAAIGGIAFLLGLSVEASLIVGGCLALSSTAMATQILKDQHRLTTPIGRLTFSVLLMQDLAVVPLLVLVPLLAVAPETSILREIGVACVTAAVAVVVIFVVGHFVIKPLFTLLGASRKPEYFLALVLLSAIGTAGATAQIGLSAAFGAFLAGLLIAETEFRHEVEIVIEPIKGLLLGVFFFSIGMQTDIVLFAADPWTILVIVAGILVIKSVILFGLCRAFRLPLAKAAESSLLLGHAGEFALMILSLAGPLGVVPPATAQMLLLVTTLSMTTTPLVAMLARRLGARLQISGGPRLPEWMRGQTESKPENHVIIAGFGRVGVMLGSILEQEGYRYVAVDQNTLKVRELRGEGYPVYFGDARRHELWSRLHAERASAVLITVDDAKAADEMLKVVRAHYPLLPVVIRAREVADMARLYEDGATRVVPEMLEASLQIAHHLLRALGKEDAEAATAIDQYRTGAAGA